MKKLVLLAAMVLSLTSFASIEEDANLNTVEQYQKYGYNYFTVFGQAFVTPTRVEVRVQNTYNRPIWCDGMAYGQTMQGQVLNSWFSGLIYPFNFGFAYVYSYHPAQRFVNGWGTFNCRFY